MYLELDDYGPLVQLDHLNSFSAILYHKLTNHNGLFWKRPCALAWHTNAVEYYVRLLPRFSMFINLTSVNLIALDWCVLIAPCDQ
jgi:hypothetical protein